MNNSSEYIPEKLGFTKAFLIELLKYKDAVIHYVEGDKESIKISKLIIDDIFNVLNIKYDVNILNNLDIENGIKEIFEYGDNSHIKYKDGVIYLFKRKNIRRANGLTKERIIDINKKIDKNKLILNVKEKINLKDKSDEELRILFLGGFKKYLLNIANKEIELLLNNNDSIKEGEIQGVSQDIYRTYFDNLNEALIIELGLLNEKDIFKLYNVFGIEVLQFFSINTEKANNYIFEGSNKLLDIILNKNEEEYGGIMNNLVIYLEKTTRKVIFNDLKNNYNMSLDSNLLKVITNLILRKLNKTYGMDIFSKVFLIKINESKQKKYLKIYNLFVSFNSKKIFKLTSPILKRELYKDIDSDYTTIKKNFDFFSDSYIKKNNLSVLYEKLEKDKNLSSELNKILDFQINIIEYENIDLHKELDETLLKLNKILNKIKDLENEINNHNNRVNIIDTGFFGKQEMPKRPKIFDGKLKKLEQKLMDAKIDQKENKELSMNIMKLRDKIHRNNSSVYMKNGEKKSIESITIKINTCEIHVEENNNIINEITKDLTNHLLINGIKK